MNTPTDPDAAQEPETRASSTSGTRPRRREALGLLVGTAHSNESSAAIRACNDYLRMGPGRSVRGLGAQYRTTATDLAPTQSYATLRAWSEKFEWQARAKQFDAHEDELLNARREQVMSQGLALDFERIEALKRVGSLLQEQIFEPGIAEGQEVDATCPQCGAVITVSTQDMVRPLPNLWLRDVKSVATKEGIQSVRVQKFNAPLLAQYRAVLDDIAKEAGDRHVYAKEYRKILEAYERIDLDKLTAQQLDEAKSGGNVLLVLLRPYFRDEYLDDSEIVARQGDDLPALSPEEQQRLREKTWQRVQESVERNRELPKQQDEEFQRSKSGL